MVVETFDFGLISEQRCIGLGVSLVKYGLVDRWKPVSYILDKRLVIILIFQ